jgi:hypothetical protein
VASTPAIPRRTAIVKAIAGDATLMGMLAGIGVHLRKMPANAPLPCIVLGPVPERPDSWYGEPGHVADEFPTCWGETLQEAEKVYAALYPVLHNRTLPLDGHRMIRGKLERLTDHPDPDVTAHGVFCRYRVTSREQAA